MVAPEETLGHEAGLASWHPSPGQGSENEEPPMCWGLQAQTSWKLWGPRRTEPGP